MPRHANQSAEQKRARAKALVLKRDGQPAQGGRKAKKGKRLSVDEAAELQVLQLEGYSGKD